jgi:hypothetical protein
MSLRPRFGAALAASAESSLPHLRHFQMPFFDDAAESLLRCPHFAHVTIGASIDKLDTDKNESSAPPSM